MLTMTSGWARVTGTGYWVALAWGEYVQWEGKCPFFFFFGRKSISGIKLTIHRLPALLLSSCWKDGFDLMKSGLPWLLMWQVERGCGQLTVFDLTRVLLFGHLYGVRYSCSEYGVVSNGGVFSSITCLPYMPGVEYTFGRSALQYSSIHQDQHILKKQ